MKKILLMLFCLFAFSMTSCGKQNAMDPFIGTPHLFLVEGGEVVESINPKEHAEYFESKENFDSLMNENGLINKDEKNGEVIAITYQEYLDMIDKKEHFVVLVSQTMCSHCLAFKSDVMNDYIKDHGVKIYEVNITNEEDPETVFNTLKEFIKE